MNDTSFKRTLITSALPYANGPLHIGHMAGAYLPSDLYTRFLRLNGRHVLHICGSDEHGVPITIAAEREGTTPQAIVDRYHELNKQTFEAFGISFDYYGRTSSAVHQETAASFFKTLAEKGVFVRKKEDQLYDPVKGMFLPDRYVKGTCPKCGFEEAYGDQCEKCGSSLSPSDLIHPVSVLSGSTPETKQTEHWYLPLGSFQERLQAWIGSHSEWKTNVLGQCQSWLSSGLSDRAVTRDLDWGVPVPLEDAAGKVLYVWFDAPIGYISATREWAQSAGKPDEWTTWWMSEETRLIHFIGKDNIVFHCIMFPAMLMAHGGYILPDQVPANEFLNLEGRKLSTSRNWAIWIHEVIRDVDPDLLRYSLAVSLPENKDSDFSWKEFQQRVNTELADIVGNFVNRTATFMERFSGGRIPSHSGFTDMDLSALDAILDQKQKISKAYETFRFKEAVHETLQLARIGNRYFSDAEPWKTRSADPDRCQATLYVCAQIAAALSVLFDPVMPTRMRRLRLQLGLPESVTWNDVQREMLPSGTAVRADGVLFGKIEDAWIQERMDALAGEAQASSNTQPPTAVDPAVTDQEAGSESETGKPAVPDLRADMSFDDFMKLDIRAGLIKQADAVEGSSKLLKLDIDLGLGTRTILSGVAKMFQPQDLVGKTVPVVANLAPRKMMGIESQGMVLFAEDAEGKLSIIETNAPPGSVIR